MQLLLNRAPSTLVCVLGSLAVDGVHECATLELPIRDGLPGSAIPDGTFSVILAPSPNFELEGRTDSWIARYASAMPHIVGIPNRSLIMLHWGNVVNDIHGCVAVGRSAGENVILHSRVAFERLYPKIQAGIASPERCLITVKSAAAPSNTPNLHAQDL